VSSRQIFLLKSMHNHFRIMTMLRTVQPGTGPSSMPPRSSSILSPGTEKQPLLVDQSSYGVASINMDSGGEESPPEAKAGWDSLTLSEKLAIFNIWNVVSTIGNTCAIWYTIRGVTLKIDIISELSLRVSIGVSCMMLWFSLVQYLEFNPRYYIMILTLKTAIPRIGQFLVGILPVFIGYSLFGLILFGDQNSLFGSLPDTATTLFCVVNGDSIMQVINSVAYLPVIGELYVCVYMMLFMYVCLMTCIAIVEESFFASADHAHAVWTHQHLLTPAGEGRDSEGEPKSRLCQERGSIFQDSPGFEPAFGATPPIGSTPPADKRAATVVRKTSSRWMPPRLRELLDSTGNDLGLPSNRSPQPIMGTKSGGGEGGGGEPLPSSGSSSMSRLFGVASNPRRGYEDDEKQAIDLAFRELQSMLLLRVGPSEGGQDEDAASGEHAREQDRHEIIRALETTKAKVLYARRREGATYGSEDSSPRI
jgi:hypothetical protein